DGTKERKKADEIPYNLGVDSATIKQLIGEKTSSGNDLLDLLMSPIPEIVKKPVSQLEAALYVAGLHPDKKIIFTLWTGNNDVLWSVINNYGTEITPDKINAYLNDTEAQHDLISVKNNLTEVVNQLKAVPNSHIFIGTLPYMTRPAFFFSKEDIERLAQYPNPKITALADGESLGFGPFLTLAGSGIFGYTSSNALANGYIEQLPETYKLSREETAITDKRIDQINNHIKSLVENGKVTVVDTFEVFQSVYTNSVEINGHKIYKTFGCGGFSFDAFHPSNTTHAMLANKFIEKINESLNLSIPMIDIKKVFENDPYQDRDGDHFAPGPGIDIIGPETSALFDCDDTKKTIVAPFISRVLCKGKR
ncbi:Lipase, GDSL domain protein, partial [Candidatus Magnetomorum sp. HK-1]